MALLLLIVVGASMGWLASIIMRTEEAGSILRQMAAGVLASTVAGLVTNSGTFLGGLSLIALGAAVAAGAAVLAIYHVIARRNADV
jgi:uncharacterized membrane protein YeaQ/YmgE (transglycosylase-associated protein family)